MADSAVVGGLAPIAADAPRSVVDKLGGGKGRSLFDLTRAGVSVPPWAILGIDVLGRFRAETGLDSLLEGELERLPTTPDDAELEAVSDRINSRIAAARLEPEVEAAVAAAYRQVGEGAVAVRSSAVGEDGARLSFAGQHATRLNVFGFDALIEAVKACWASAWSPRALRYRLLHEVSMHGIEMAVVVQVMVAAEKSGVLFTVSPAAHEAEEMMVSAAYGLGEAVVSGAVDPDTLVLERGTGVVRKEILGSKELRIDPLPTGGCRTGAVSSAARSAPVLSAEEVEELYRTGMSLERLAGGPMDVEWAWAEGKLWILQSRPIVDRSSPALAGPEDDLRVWDNSNIIESYGEIVAPLTYTFARRLYHGVFREHCKLLGVPPRQLDAADEWLQQLLGYFHGRVYYNLLNWYRIVRMVPFYSVNRRVLEISIGAAPLDRQLADRQHPFVFRNRLESALVKARMTLRFFWCFVWIHSLVRSFLGHFRVIYEEFDGIEYSGREAHELYGLFVEMERRLLPRWGRMNMLETSIGLSFGSLYALTARWLPQAPPWFLYETVRTSSEVESLRPVHQLEEIAKEVAADRDLRDKIATIPAAALDDVLKSAEEESACSLVKRIDDYLDEFGYRSANELKLEEPDLREDPASFYSILKEALRRLEAGGVRTGEDRPTADGYLSEHLRGWRRWLYELVRRRVRRCLAEREQVRFCRTRIFGLSRRMFRAAGEDMVKKGALENSSDIFYLRLEELRGCCEGSVGHGEMASLVALRKGQEESDRLREMPPRFITRGGVYWDALDRALAEAADRETPIEGKLRGTPCSPGVVHGRACVLERPEDAGGGILVAYRTDPGWVNVLRSASALLIERGSPLTHVALVARELEIPTVVQIPGLTRQIRTGMKVTVDGGSGSIELSGEEKRVDDR